MAGARERRIEGRIEWRSKLCDDGGHRHSQCAFRAVVYAGIDPIKGMRRYLSVSGRGNAKAAEAALRDLLSK
jgi:hypothetical protein